MSIKCAVLGTSGSWYNHRFKLNHVVHDLSYVLPEPARYESRGGAANCGDGPFFRMVAKPKWKRNGAVVDLGTDDFYAEYTNYQGFRTKTMHQEWRVEGREHYIENIETLNGEKTTSSYTCVTYYTPPVDSRYIAHRRTLTLTWNGTKWIATESEGEISGNTGYEYVNQLPSLGKLYDEFLNAVVWGYFRPDQQQAFAAAYLEAYRSLPEADVNLMGNLKEALDYIKGAIGAIKDPKSAISSLLETTSNPKQLWLSYRYVYKTNQQDAKEMQELVSRLDYLSSVTKAQLKATGWATSGGVRYGVSMRIPLSTVLPQDLIDLVHMFGLNVTPSNIWDLIPYSFMVDWFLGIGDKISFFEDWIGAAELKPMNIWFQARAESEDAVYYYRVPGYVPNVPPLYTSHEASGKTIVMRVADTISIFT